ncbi:MAG: hypothetical protein KDC95_03925 [Planctomycetes bacterium]|nr:hypothetical protein [Planctomycetota bacterium]
MIDSRFRTFVWQTRLVVVLAVWFAIAGSVVAQTVTAVWTATSDLSAAAIGSDGFRSARIVSSTRIGRTLLSADRANARASVHCVEYLTNGNHAFQLDEVVEASGTASLTHAGRTGVHRTAIHLTSPTPLRAFVTVDVAGSGSGSGSSQVWDYNAAVQLDQQLLFSISKSDRRPSLRIPIVLGPAGTTIETLTGALAASAGGLARSRMTLHIGVAIETKCTSSAYGTSCAGMLTMVQNFDGSVDLRVATGTLQLTRGFGLIGLKRQNLRIAGTNCWLHTDVYMALPFTTDWFGSARLSGFVAPAFRGSFTAQAALFPASGIGTTQGLSVACQ